MEGQEGKRRWREGSRDGVGRKMGDEGGVANLEEGGGRGGRKGEEEE